MDGLTVRKPSQRCSAGTVVELDTSVHDVATHNFFDGKAHASSVLYEDSHLVAINKPSGLAVHPARGVKGDTAIQSLRRLITPSVNLCHRLDKPTSGVLLATKSHPALRRLALEWNSELVLKAYIAISSGVPREPLMVLEAPLLRRSNGTVVVASNSRASRALASKTTVATIAADGQRALLGVVLGSGRTHQIRAHLAHAGFPLVGDLAYDNGDVRAARLSGDRLPRLMLHSHVLAFLHPMTRQLVTVTAPLPAEMAEMAVSMVGLPSHGDGSVTVAAADMEGWLESKMKAFLAPHLDALVHASHERST